MGMVEHTHYVLVCPQCRATGVAWETDGCAYLRRPTRGLVISGNFERVPTESSGPQSFYSRPLVCKDCGVDAEYMPITSVHYFAIERPVMRSVAGNHGDPSIPDTTHSEDRR